MACLDAEAPGSWHHERVPTKYSNFVPKPPGFFSEILRDKFQPHILGRKKMIQLDGYEQLTANMA